MADKKIDIHELIEKGKTKGSLSQSEIMEALEDDDFDIDQIENIYETLEKNGIEAGADKTVETIINRDKTGMCPMENAVKDIHDADVEKMVETLRKAIKK